MFKNLSAGAIGIRNLSLQDTIQLAAKTGYAGIDFNIREAVALADAQGAVYMRDLFAASDVLPADGHVVPVRFRHSAV